MSVTDEENSVRHKNGGNIGPGSKTGCIEIGHVDISEQHANKTKTVLSYRRRAYIDKVTGTDHRV